MEEHGPLELKRASVEATSLPAIAERATISIGIATRERDEGGSGWEVLLKEADARLYRAKTAGRNRVI